MPNMAMFTANRSAVAVPGMGIMPRMRLLPLPSDPRARAGRAAAPQSGQTLALRSMRPRQEGHILYAEGGLDSRDPNMRPENDRSLPNVASTPKTDKECRDGSKVARFNPSNHRRHLIFSHSKF